VVKKRPEKPPDGENQTDIDATAHHMRVEATVDLPPGAEVRLTIQYRPDEKTPFLSKVMDISGGVEKSRRHLSFELESLSRSWFQPEWLSERWKDFVARPDLPVFLLVFALLIYYLIRLIHLSDYPIFFFTDEAVHTMLASSLLQNGFTGANNEVLPTFFRSGETYNAGFPVYLQVIPELMGIRSVFMTRLVTVTSSLLAAGSLGMLFTRLYDEKRGWLAVLVLSIIPAWFYHSRTGFETVIAVSLFAVFLLGYHYYRSGNFRWIYVSLVAAALAFYSYSPARVVIAAMALLLLFSDLRYHWENRGNLWKPFLIGLVLTLPYFRFLYLHPGENQHHLVMLSSYWTKNEPISWKLLQYGKTYLQGLNPYYWFFPNSIDLERHTMKGMGHLGWYFLPFFIGGVAMAIRRWKNPGYRMMLLSILAAPAGAAVAEIGITRALFMTIPAAFFISIGLDYTLQAVYDRLKLKLSYNLAVCGLLVITNFWFLDKVLTEGPLWFNDYGMGGMQYGAEKVFHRIEEIRKENPDVPIVMSPNWANGTDTLVRFFLGDPMPIELASLNAYIEEFKPFSADTIFIIPPDELHNLINSAKFETIQVTDVIFYPDGKPGFVFAHLKYNTRAWQVFEEDKKTLDIMTVSHLQIDGRDASVASSLLDMGDAKNVFDNDPATLIRTKEANPLVLEIAFDQPVRYHAVSLRIGGSATRLTVYAASSDSDQVRTNSVVVKGSTELRKVKIPLPSDKPFSRLRIEVKTVFDNTPAHVHLWDVGLE